PFGKSGDSFGSRLIRSFRAGTIFTAEAGRPFPTSINTTSIPFSTPDGAQWTGFGFNLFGQGGANLLPTVPRNNNTGDANYRVDLRLSRQFYFKERYRLEVLGESFNLFNRANFNQYNSTLYDTVTTVAATTSATTPVQFQKRTNFGTPFGDG